MAAQSRLSGDLQLVRAAHICVHSSTIIDRGRTVRVNLFIAFVGLVGILYRVCVSADTNFHDRHKLSL